MRCPSSKTRPMMRRTTRPPCRRPRPPCATTRTMLLPPWPVSCRTYRSAMRAGRRSRSSRPRLRAASPLLSGSPSATPGPAAQPMHRPPAAMLLMQASHPLMGSHPSMQRELRLQRMQHACWLQCQPSSSRRRCRRRDRRSLRVFSVDFALLAWTRPRNPVLRARHGPLRRERDLLAGARCSPSVALLRRLRRRCGLRVIRAYHPPIQQGLSPSAPAPSRPAQGQLLVPLDHSAQCWMQVGFGRTRSWWRLH